MAAAVIEEVTIRVGSLQKRIEIAMLERSEKLEDRTFLRMLSL